MAVNGTKEKKDISHKSTNNRSEGGIQNTFAARATEGQGWVLLVLDLDESVKHHRAAPEAGEGWATSLDETPK